MKVLVVGGGSGGHITPAVAVVRELMEKNTRWSFGRTGSITRML